MINEFLRESGVQQQMQHTANPNVGGPSDNVKEVLIAPVVINNPFDIKQSRQLGQEAEPSLSQVVVMGSKEKKGDTIYIPPLLDKFFYFTDARLMFDNPDAKTSLSITVPAIISTDYTPKRFQQGKDQYTRATVTLPGEHFFDTELVFKNNKGYPQNLFESYSFRVASTVANSVSIAVPSMDKEGNLILDKNGNMTLEFYSYTTRFEEKHDAEGKFLSEERLLADNKLYYNGRMILKYELGKTQEEITKNAHKGKKVISENYLRMSSSVEDGNVQIYPDREFLDDKDIVTLEPLKSVKYKLNISSKVTNGVRIYEHKAIPDNPNSEIVLTEEEFKCNSLIINAPAVNSYGEAGLVPDFISKVALTKENYKDDKFTLKCSGPILLDGEVKNLGTAPSNIMIDNNIRADGEKPIRIDILASEKIIKDGYVSLIGMDKEYYENKDLSDLENVKFIKDKNSANKINLVRDGQIVAEVYFKDFSGKDIDLGKDNLIYNIGIGYLNEKSDVYSRTYSAINQTRVAGVYTDEQWDIRCRDLAITQIKQNNQQDITVSKLNESYSEAVLQNVIARISNNLGQKGIIDNQAEMNEIIQLLKDTGAQFNIDNPGNIDKDNITLNYGQNSTFNLDIKISDGIKVPSKSK